MRMLYSSILLAISSFAIAWGSPPTPPTADQEEVATLVTHFVHYWNLHDPQGIASLWLEDGDLIKADGTWARGRSEVEKLFVEEQAGLMRNSSLHLAIQNARMFSNDTAWIDLNGIILNINDTPDTSRTFEHHVIFLLVKQNQQWRIAAVRPYQFYQGNQSSN